MSVERDVVSAIADAWDAAPDGIWEPWAPKVGDRVRVHLSAECQFEYLYGNRTKHFPESDGACGVISEIDGCGPGEHDQGHRYTVRFSPQAVSLVNEPGWLSSHCFAAIELLPLDGAS